MTKNWIIQLRDCCTIVIFDENMAHGKSPDKRLFLWNAIALFQYTTVSQSFFFKAYFSHTKRSPASQKGNLHKERHKTIIYSSIKEFNLFQVNVSILSPLKTSKISGLLMFPYGIKEEIGLKRVSQCYVPRSTNLNLNSLPRGVEISWVSILIP